MMGRRHIPKYRHHKSTGRAVVTLDGREVYLGKHGTEESRQRYEQAIAEWLANGRKLPGSEADAIAIVELIAAYNKHTEVYYRDQEGEATTMVSLVKTSLRRLRKLYGPTLVTDFGPLALQALRQTWVDDGLTRNTVNKYVRTVCRAFRWGVAQELVPETIHRALTSVSGLATGRSAAKETPRKVPVPEAHINAIHPFVSRQVWSVIQLQLLTSARGGELLRMRPIDLDVTGEVWVYSPQRHKTTHHGHERTIWLGPRAKAVIRPFLTGRPTDAYLFSPREATQERYDQAETHRQLNQAPPNPKSKRQIRDRYDKNSYRRCIERACEKANVPSWTPHRLRHNAGTMVRRDYGIEAARLVLGVCSGDLAEVYAERDHARAREIIMKIG